METITYSKCMCARLYIQFNPLSKKNVLAYYYYSYQKLTKIKTRFSIEKIDRKESELMIRHRYHLSENNIRKVTCCDELDKDRKLWASEIPCKNPFDWLLGSINPAQCNHLYVPNMADEKATSFSPGMCLLWVIRPCVRALDSESSIQTTSIPTNDFRQQTYFDMKAREKMV